MTILDLMFGNSSLVVGIGDTDDGATKVYLGARHDGHYVIVDDPEDQRRIRLAWGGSGVGHLTTPTPPEEAIHCDNPEHQHWTILADDPASE